MIFLLIRKIKRGILAAHVRAAVVTLWGRKEIKSRGMRSKAGRVH